MHLVNVIKSWLLVGILVMANYLTLQGQPKERSNILLIMTDQHQAEALSIAGNEDLRTPNLDRLAKSGMRFDRAYVSFPLCTPARSSMFTGKMPHTLGVYSNKDGESAMLPGERKNILGKVLKDAGYDVAYGGKWHAHKASMSPGNGFKRIAPFGDIGLADKSIEYLESKKDSNKPFFLVTSFDNPHNICEWARNQPLPYGNVPAVDIEHTPQLPENFERTPSFPEALQIEHEASKRLYPTENYTKEDWRQYRYAYYRLVEKVDAQIGKILDAIDDLGLRENTLIIFTSDHGDGNASHGWNQKTALFEELIRVPFIVSYKGVIQKAQTATSTLISNGLDLYPTILDYANISIPKELPGKTLKPVLEGERETLDREFLTVETKFAGKHAFDTMGRTIVGKRYKYILYSWGKNREQLFDLRQDPFEMNNLADSRSHQATLDRFRQRLYEWSKSTNDPFLRKIILPSSSNIPSSKLFDRAY